jgi:structural maintenance of chromosome 4
MQGLRVAEAEVDRLLKSGPQIDITLEKLGLDVENGKQRIFEAQKRVRELNAFPPLYLTVPLEHQRRDKFGP